VSAELGVVVLCYGPDADPNVSALLENLAAQGVGPGSMTVVQNPSRDQPKLALPKAEISLLAPDRNVGYAGGMNLGIKHLVARGCDLLLLLTMDARLQPSAVERLVEAAIGTPAFGVLGPELRWTGTGRTSYGVMWGRGGAIDHIVVAPDSFTFGGIVECDSIDGAIVMTRREVVEKVGLLQDRLFMYYEETEFCLRVKRAGWKVGVVGGAVGEQSPGESRRPGAFNYLVARNGLEFSRQLAGSPGVVSALGRDIAQSWRLLRMRFSPRSGPGRRRYATVSLVGLWRGVLAYFQRRWGPPPVDLPGLGDITLAN